MAKISFFPLAAAPALAEIAQWTGAKLGEGADPGRIVRDVAPLDEAGPDDLTFLDNPRYLDAFRSTRAGAAFVAPRHAAEAPRGCALLVTPQPYRAMARSDGAPLSAGGQAALGVRRNRRFAGRLRASGGAARTRRRRRSRRGDRPGRGDRRRRADRPQCGRSARTCASAAIPSIGAQATVVCALIGDRVIIHPGVHIGQDGFGFALGPRGHLKVPQVGRVIIQDDVEIGAKTTIDRGANRDTIIGEGTKIDNLVQIAHNVVIGRHCVLVAQAGVSGSTVIGDFVALGGQAGLTGHLKIGDGAPDRRPVRGDARRAGGRAMGRIPGRPAARVSPPGGDAASADDRAGSQAPSERRVGAAPTAGRLAATAGTGRRGLTAAQGPGMAPPCARGGRNGRGIEGADDRELRYPATPRLLPHRYPFLLVDRIVETRGDEYCVGIKNVTINEPQFQGHFPEKPVMPGVLLIEGMAQTAGALCVAQPFRQRAAERRLFHDRSTRRNSASR